jgi:signal transduction histidine kinase
MFDLLHFSLEDVVQCGGSWQRAAAPTRSFEEAATAIVQCLYQDFSDERHRPFLLVRLFATQTFGKMPEDLREFARKLVGGRDLSPDQKCLVLMASAGERPEWNSRKSSLAHQAIPLESDRLAIDFPMISQLLAQLGAIVTAPSGRIMLERSQHTYNVFYVRRADGSPHVVDQETFVEPFGVRSVIGFGGGLPSGESFAVVAFSRVEIPPQVAELFRYLALNAKLALLPFDGAAYFQEAAAAPTPTVHDILTSLSVQGATAADLLRTCVMIAADWLERSRVLAELSGELASVLHTDDAIEVFRKFLLTRVADGVRIELEGGPVTRLVQHGNTVVLSQLDRANHGALLAALDGAKCAVAIPMQTRGQMFGAVALHWAAEHAFEPMEITYFEQLVHRFGITLDNARLFAATVAERQHAEDEAAFAERLVAIVSHDLRNPLTVIRLASRALARKPLAPADVEAAELIARSSERMKRLIGQLLDFARLHRGMSLPMKFESAHLYEIAKRMVEEAQRGVPGSQIALELAGRDDILCDVVGVEAILSNLLNNAIQHGAEGPIQVRIRETDAGIFAIDIHNPGPAIPGDEQATMFEAFHRRASAGDAHTKSLGLGLYITREIVRAHGGAIRVVSPDGDGTTFSVLLPRRPTPPAEPLEPAAHH